MYRLQKGLKATQPDSGGGSTDSDDVAAHRAFFDRVVATVPAEMQNEFKRRIESLLRTAELAQGFVQAMQAANVNR
jgi:hypothetical protein